MHKVFSRYILPATMLFLLFYGLSHSKEIANNYKYMLGIQSEVSEQEASLRLLRSTQNDFYGNDSEDKLLNLEEIRIKLSSLPGCTIASERTLSLVGGVWSPSSSDGEAQEFVIRVENMSVGLFNLDSIKLYYEAVNANMSDNTITLIVRTKGVV